MTVGHELWSSIKVGPYGAWISVEMFGEFANEDE
jgi:hypothetical protein